MPQILIKILKFAFFLALGIVLVWWSIHQIPDKEFESFKTSLKYAKYWLIFPVFIILLSSHIVRALRWKLLMKPMGYNPSLLNTILAIIIGYLANLAFPRLGEILKCTLLAKYEKIPAQKSVGTIVVERCFDLLGLLALFCVALLVQFPQVKAAYSQLKSFVAPTSQDTNSTVETFVYSIIFVAIIVLIAWLIKSKKLNLFVTKLKQIGVGLTEGLMSVWHSDQKVLFIVYTILIWVLYVLGTWVGLYATEGTFIGIDAAISGLAFASIGMILTPGGIGAYAYFLALVLSIKGNDVEYSKAIANGTLQWFAQFIIVLVLGSVSLLVLPIYNKRIEKENNI
jgi:glycosyltransferase 2 family protein